MNTKRRYDVLTWNTDRQYWTPQRGCRVRMVNVSIRGLRKALRALRNCGYSAHRTRYPNGEYDSDTSVLVQAR